MDKDLVPIAPSQLLTDARFHQLAAVPPELEWFANIDNARTRRAYKVDLADFSAHVGVCRPEDFRTVTRAHVIDWRHALEQRGLAAATIRRKLAALSSLFEYLCERNAVEVNPVKGTRRPKVDSNEGKTPALGDHEARALLAAPNDATLKGKRDRAILSTLLYHGLRREELCRLCKVDIQMRRGVAHLRVHGKGSKVRYVPLHPATAALIHDYLQASGHAVAGDSPLFLPMRDTRRGLDAGAALTPNGVYVLLQGYVKAAKLDFAALGPHSLRATAATNALDHAADIAKVQEWLGHANIATTRIYDHRKTRPEDSPTFKVAY